jgi:hypothetical protein
MSPFYRRLPPPLPFAPEVTADQIGQALVGGVAVATVAHGGASYVRQRRIGAAERRDALAAVAAETTPPGSTADAEIVPEEPLAAPADEALSPSVTAGAEAVAGEGLAAIPDEVAPAIPDEVAPPGGRADAGPDPGDPPSPALSTAEVD